MAGNSLQPARHAVQSAERLDGVRRIHARHEREADGGQRIVSLERAGERQSDVVPGTQDRDAQVLAGLGVVSGQQPQVRAGGAIGEHLLPPRAAAPGETRHARVVGVENCGGVGRHDLLEEARLRREVGVRVGVVIHVIAREGRERRRLDADAIQTVLRKPVARRLQCQMVDAVCCKLGQDAMQGDRIGRRVLQRTPPAVHTGAESPEGRCLAARGPPDLAGEVGHRSLAVGPGDAGHD